MFLWEKKETWIWNKNDLKLKIEFKEFNNIEVSICSV